MQAADTVNRNQALMKNLATSSECKEWETLVWKGKLELYKEAVTKISVSALRHCNVLQCYCRTLLARNGDTVIKHSHNIHHLF